jgi:hypothetical protein
MKVKFTNPARFSKDANGQTILNPFFDTALDGPTVLFGNIVEMYQPAGTLIVEYCSRGFTIQTLINPNSDYNFGFIPNEEADLKYELALGKTVEELELLDKQAARSK